MTTVRTTPLALLVLLALAFALPADDKDKKDAKAGEPLLVTDSSGKEHKVKEWKWKLGTRHLGWLAEDKEPEKDKKKPRNEQAGPEAFALREGQVEWKDGVMTLIPLDRVRSVAFDKDTVSVTAAGDKEDVKLTGSTKYKLINKFTFEAEVDKGDLGLAEVVYQAGIPESNLKMLTFPEKKVEAIKGGRPAFVETLDKDKATHKVTDLMPLYEIGGREKLVPLLMFKKTLKLDVTKLRSITAANTKTDTIWQVTPKGGEVETLTLLTETKIDNQDATLVGLVGKVAVGYKLFPARRIVSVQFDSEEARNEQLPPPKVEDEKDEKKEEKKD